MELIEAKILATYQWHYIKELTNVLVLMEVGHNSHIGFCSKKYSFEIVHVLQAKYVQIWGMACSMRTFYKIGFISPMGHTYLYKAIVST